MLIAAFTMDLAGRKVLLFVSGEAPCARCPPGLPSPRHGRLLQKPCWSSREHKCQARHTQVEGSLDQGRW